MQSKPEKPMKSSHRVGGAVCEVVGAAELPEGAEAITEAEYNDHAAKMWGGVSKKAERNNR